MTMSMPDDHVENGFGSGHEDPFAFDSPKWLPAFARGLFAALVGGFLWGLFTWMAGVRVEWLPVLSVGFVVGLAVRGSERHTDWRFGASAACLALLGCLFAECWS